MKPGFPGLCVGLALCASPLMAQLPPLGAPPAAPAGQTPAPNAAAAPSAPVSSLSLEAENADLKAARAANQDKRFADAETLMLKDTAARPDQPFLWIELGLAQLGEKKYPEAEASFTAALGKGKSAAQKPANNVAGFYQEGKGTAGHVAISSSPEAAAPKSHPEIEAVSYASLGDIYIHTNRIPEGQAAFDKAVAANPPQAGFYYGNEAVFLFQAGNAPAQLEAANKAIAADPARARNYYFKAQALTTQATVDAKTNKLILPPGCLEAYQKYLELEPNGQFAPDTKAILTAAGISANPSGKK